MVTPIKRLERAKSRLAARLSERERQRLVFAMFLDLLDAARQCQDLAGICVVTDDKHVAMAARNQGAVVVRDPVPGGLSQAYVAGIQRAVALGAHGVVLVPGDLPLACAEDLSALVCPRPTHPLVRLVPTCQGTGTNAMFLWPSGIVAPCYEGNSFATHLAAAAARGIKTEVVTNARLSLDIDHPDDLLALGRQRPGRQTRRALAELAWPSVLTG